jgi:hypothetical protein
LPAAVIEVLLSAVHQHHDDNASILKHSAAVPYPSCARPTLPKALDLALTSCISWAAITDVVMLAMPNWLSAWLHVPRSLLCHAGELSV